MFYFRINYSIICTDIATQFVLLQAGDEETSAIMEAMRPHPPPAAPAAPDAFSPPPQSPQHEEVGSTFISNGLIGICCV